MFIELGKYFNLLPATGKIIYLTQMLINIKKLKSVDNINNDGSVGFKF